MARRVKCPHCGKLNDKEVAVQRSNKYYCADCLEQVKKQKKDHDDLYDYICELFEIDKLNGWHHKQIKEMKENYGYTYRQMRFVLKYFFEIKGNSTSNAQGIGIIAFVFDEASDYYKSLKTIKDSAQKTDMNQLTSSKTISIKKSDIEESDHYSKIKEIDIDDIELDDDE